MAYRKDWGQPQPGPQGFARTQKVFGRTMGILAADVGTINNVVGCFMVPAGFTLTAALGTFPSLAASALTLSLGDAANPARLLSASTIGVAGGAMPALAAGAFLYRWNADTEIILTVAAAGVTPAAGAPVILLQGFMW